jgi:nuclear pore complex protein Nup155
MSFYSHLAMLTFKIASDFSPSVKWILVVTTPDEIIQLMLYNSEDDAAFKIRASSFNLPTDNVRMISVVGTDIGRIFLGGEDGCLYEVVYQNDNTKAGHATEAEILNAFYDNGEEVGETICLDGTSSVVGTIVSLGKRTLGINGSTSPESQRPKKCRKLNRTSPSWVSAVVPDVVLKAAGFLFGGKTATGGGPIVKMVVDEHRKTLYTLSRAGLICSFALYKENVQLAAVMETPRKVQLYLEAVARGQMNPPSSGSSGYISFNGNGLAAQAGVGGIEGARAILKYADMRRKRANGSAPAYDSSLVPLSIHVISPVESQHLTLLAVTGCGLRLYFSSLLSNSKSLMPSTQLTLCHIRAPPPTDQKQELTSLVDDSGFVGGIKPYVEGADKAIIVDASFYNDGIFMAAIESKMTQQDSRTPLTGDSIIATFPGSSYRTLEKNSREPDDQEEKSIVPGGIVETVRLPMQQIMGSSAGGGNPLLPGGVVIDMALLSSKESMILKLAKGSLTPSDNELSIGLPAEYSPTLKTRSHRSLDQNIDESITAIVVRDHSFAGSIVALMTNLLPNTVFARAVHNGVFVPGQEAGHLLGRQAKEPTYRVSSRDGADGYSLTAAEKIRYAFATASGGNRGQQATSKSVRLSQWLLRPPMVPLNQVALQPFFEPTKNVVALNAGGLHYFSFSSILMSLADTLIAAGENVASDESITNFFKKYGYKEGCAMCLSLAVGCAPASGQSVGALQLRERASNAAFARSYTPRLLPRQLESTNSSSPVDSILPNGYEFRSSELYNGLISLISRLLRPVWFKPTVVVTEGRVVKSAWSKAVRITPAKVEVLLCREKLEQIQTPLANLLQVMKKLFTRALASIPGLPQNQTSMDMDDDMAEENIITKAITYQHQIRADMNGTSNLMSSVEAERMARLIEERNIHSLYRLTTRAVQVLNLLSLLYRSQDISELREVDWGLLHGLTVAQLAETRDGQDRVERLLNSLVTASAADGFGKVAPSVLVDQIASHFAEQCYNYFSPGSRSAFLGFLRANEALESTIGSSQRVSLTNQAGNYFRNAAKHWVSAPIITGRILHSRGRELYSDIALRAFEYQSPLAKASDLLIQLDDVATAVEICLLTSMNFQTNGSSTSTTNLFASEKVPTNAAFPWERQLYRKQVDVDSSNAAGSRTAFSPPSPSQSVARGVSVTAQDAIDTCYSLIFYYFAKLIASDRDGDRRKAFELVSSCTATGKRAFLFRFFTFLLAHGHVETLLLIESPAVEEWIQSRKDLDLLWRFYTVQQRAIEAGEISFSRATDASATTSLDDRIEYLSRAVSSFKYKLEETQNIAFNATDDGTQNALALYRERLNLARDTLSIARIQKRVLSALDSRQKLTRNLLWQATLTMLWLVSSCRRLIYTIISLLPCSSLSIVC